LNTYNALENFDVEDVEGIVSDVRLEVGRLPDYHAALWAIFDTVPNKRDTEALERFLAPEDVRQAFYQALTQFARTLKVALGTVAFYEETPQDKIDAYKRDFKFFHNLRNSVQRRYAETIDYKDYEQKIRGLMNKHIQSSDVVAITKLVNIFDTEAFEEEVERIAGAAAKADTIANRIKITLTERMDQDPATYRRFSDMIDETIAAYRAGRLSEAEYLAAMAETLQQIQTGQVRDIPATLEGRQDARAYFSTLRELPVGYNTGNDDGADSELLAEAALELERIVARRKVRDWTRNYDIQNAMRKDIEE
jgi:type I restriction enzyme R subunit